MAKACDNPSMSELWYTLGPRTLGRESEVAEAGATGVRLTFSYSTAPYQLERATEHRRMAERLGRPFLVIADLAGEKFRLGTFEGPPSFSAADGRHFKLILGQVSRPAVDDVLTVTSAAFFSQVRKGDFVVVGDGAAELYVDEITDDGVELTVSAGGTINHTRGLTVRGSNFQPRCLTEKDMADLAFVSRADAFDAVALSFVAGSADIERARAVLGPQSTIIAKIETAAGVADASRICEAADVVMAARGDLALTVPWLELPWAVAEIEAAALTAGTPWIVATQLAEGLERFILPTRAEICDLAHWMSRGCAGALVSYETAFGSHPVEATRCVRLLMDRWSPKATATE